MFLSIGVVAYMRPNIGYLTSQILLIIMVSILSEFYCAVDDLFVVFRFLLGTVLGHGIAEVGRVIANR